MKLHFINKQFNNYLLKNKSNKMKIINSKKNYQRKINYLQK